MLVRRMHTGLHFFRIRTYFVRTGNSIFSEKKTRAMCLRLCLRIVYTPSCLPAPGTLNTIFYRHFSNYIIVPKVWIHYVVLNKQAFRHFSHMNDNDTACAYRYVKYNTTCGGARVRQ